MLRFFYSPYATCHTQSIRPKCHSLPDLQPDLQTRCRLVLPRQLYELMRISGR